VKSPGAPALALSAALGGLAVLATAPASARARSGPALVARAAVGYRNGRRVKLRLVEVGWAEVEIRTARAFLAMRDAAARAGVDLWILSGFRSQEQQAALYRAWREGWGNRAARPGYSNHQSGRALDLFVGAPGTRGWLEAHAHRFGFRQTVPGEPWHWEFVEAGRRRPRTLRTFARTPAAAAWPRRRSR
jgi:hypothetical protein